MPDKQGAYCIYKTIQRATAVTDCVACKFTSANADNLILAKGNILEIYELTKEGVPIQQTASTRNCSTTPHIF